MVSRIIKLSYPGKTTGEVRLSISKIKISTNVNTVYDSVSFLERNIFPMREENLAQKKVKKKVALRDILNIHNDDGIKDLGQVGTMAKSIKSGEHIQPIGIPNIKLVRAKDNDLLLFDGHHSMLAYMAVGKRYLEEIPHMIIEDEGTGYVEDQDILVFYGEHSKEIENNNWKEYVINWQAVKEKQLARRVQRNMGELFFAVKERIEHVQ